VRAHEVVEFEVATNARSRFVEVFVGMQENFFVLERAPDALDEDVVDASTSAVHADRDSSAAQYAGERLRGELRALVGVEYCRLWKARQRLLQRLHAEGALQRVGEPPRSDVLPALAKALGVKVEEILGDAPVNAARRPGPVGKLQKIFEQAVSLPRKEQELVAKFVATLLEQHKKAS
jgi:hypothetical protein